MNVIMLGVYLTIVNVVTHNVGYAATNLKVTLDAEHLIILLLVTYLAGVLTVIKLLLAILTRRYPPY